MDQFGYINDAEKVAVLSDPVNGYNAALSYTPPATLELRNSTNNLTVFSGPVALWNGGATHDDSGDRGWWFDFSAYTATGSYYVYDPVNSQRSAVFEITTNPYGHVLIAACKMFYYNRCNLAKTAPYAQAKWTDATNFLNPLQDANCRFIGSPANAALEKELSGGWFDAGDYNKYVSFTNSPMHDLLYAYEENPAVFTDNFSIPESGNGLPDLIDEIKWELDWLKKMINANGSVHNKMGSRNYSENTSSPPSANTNQRYYGPTCTSASATIASVFAHASVVLGKFPALATYATDLQTKSITCYNYVLPFYTANTLQTNCDDGSIVAGDADVGAEAQLDMLVTAAVYLYEKTGESTYNQFIVNNYNQTNLMKSNYWEVNATELQDALLRYTQLAGAISSVKNVILNSATTMVTNNWNHFYGWNTLDLYRGFMPEWSYDWGSNMLKADYGTLNRSMAKKGIGNVASQFRKAAEELHYFHGINPQGKVYLSNMYQYGGDNCVNEIYHAWFNDGTIYDNALTSSNGPAPGYLSGGPNPRFTVSSLSPPYGQPRQKAYLDFNTGWPQNSWEITEPAIYYQASYIRFLANYTLPLDSPPLPVELFGFSVKEICCGQAQIQWKTASETNNEQFEVERSADGFDFKKIGVVAGKKTTIEAQAYYFTDPKILSNTAYYRLKQVDSDGTFAYSKIISLSKTTHEEFLISPNPVRDYLQINGPKLSGTSKVVIRDLAGKLVLQRQTSMGDKIDTRNLNPGIYLVTVEIDNSRTFTQKIIKN